MSTLNQPSPGIRALFAGLALAYGHDDDGRPFSDMEEVQREAFGIEIQEWHKHQGRKAPAIVLDSGNTHQLWLFSFGACGTTDVYVWGDGDVCAALEAAAETLPKGFFTEFDRADREAAASDLGIDPDTDDEDEEEKIMCRMEVDMTHTQCGLIASWEWWVTEIEPEEALARMWDGR